MLLLCAVPAAAEEESILGQPFPEFSATDTEVTWEYGEFAQPEPAELSGYVLYVVDQDGQPVPGATVHFCTDTACVPLVSDENGTVVFTGAPDLYRVRLFRVPEGYRFDEGFEFTTSRTYGAWRLRVQRD